jgi:hypothetical protein
VPLIDLGQFLGQAADNAEGTTAFGQIGDHAPDSAEMVGYPCQGIGPFLRIGNGPIDQVQQRILSRFHRVTSGTGMRIPNC